MLLAARAIYAAKHPGRQACLPDMDRRDTLPWTAICRLVAHHVCGYIRGMVSLPSDGLGLTTISIPELHAAPVFYPAGTRLIWISDAGEIATIDRQTAAAQLARKVPIVCHRRRSERRAAEAAKVGGRRGLRGHRRAAEPAEPAEIVVARARGSAKIKVGRSRGRGAERGKVVAVILWRHHLARGGRRGRRGEVSEVVVVHGTSKRRGGRTVVEWILVVSSGFSHWLGQKSPDDGASDSEDSIRRRRRRPPALAARALASPRTPLNPDAPFSTRATSHSFPPRLASRLTILASSTHVAASAQPPYPRAKSGAALAAKHGTAGTAPVCPCKTSATCAQLEGAEPESPHKLIPRWFQGLRFHWKGGHERPALNTASAGETKLISSPAMATKALGLLGRRAATKMRASQTFVHPTRWQHMF